MSGAQQRGMPPLVAPLRGAQARGGPQKSISGDVVLLKLTQASLAALCRAPGLLLGTPVLSLLAAYVAAFRAVLKLTLWTERCALRGIGWLGSPAFGRSAWARAWSRAYVPLDVRKWHVVFGE
jgi:hypothetical protein